MKTSFINASKNDMHFQKRCSFFFYIRLFKNWFFKGSYLKEKWRNLCSLLCNVLLDVPEYIVHFHQFDNYRNRNIQKYIICTYKTTRIIIANSLCISKGFQQRIWLQNHIFDSLQQRETQLQIVKYILLMEYVDNKNHDYKVHFGCKFFWFCHKKLSPLTLCM